MSRTSASATADQGTIQRECSAATLGTYAATVVRGRSRDRAAQLGLYVLSDERVQRLLRKRDPGEPTPDR